VGTEIVTTTDSLTDGIRSDILSGIYSPGERLVELHLSERYDSGRGPVREALLQLESEGLVERQANRGAVVRRISTAEAIEITEARAVLESLIARRAAHRANDDDRTALRATIAEMRSAVAANDGLRYSALNGTLHGLIRTIGGHSIAGEMVENLRNRAVQNQYRLAMMPGRAEVSLEQHAAIVEAIAAGDAEAAAAAMNEHLHSVIEVLDRWGDAR